MSAHAVGGCVRDWRLGIAETVDLDVAIEGDGIAMASAAARALGGTITTHQQFGTATVVIRPAASRPPRARRGSVPSVRIDFATCRKETYAKPAAYPKVAAGTLEEDLLRPDFTINAMAMALTPGCFGLLIDPFGGARDLRERRLRILHPRSFVDDPSRILRGMRFAQRFGLRWERRTKRAARDAMTAGALGWLNAGRLQRECDLMAHEPTPRGCLAQLAVFLGVPVEPSMTTAALMEGCRRRIEGLRASHPRPAIGENIQHGHRRPAG